MLMEAPSIKGKKIALISNDCIPLVIKPIAWKQILVLKQSPRFIFAFTKNNFSSILILLTKEINYWVEPEVCKMDETFRLRNEMSRVVRKTAFCICENKAPDQLRGNREADQRLCFRYTDSTIPLLPKYGISSL